MTNMTTWRYIVYLLNHIILLLIIAVVYSVALPLFETNTFEWIFKICGVGVALSAVELTRFYIENKQ